MSRERQILFIVGSIFGLSIIGYLAVEIFVARNSAILGRPQREAESHYYAERHLAATEREQCWKSGVKDCDVRIPLPVWPGKVGAAPAPAEAAP